MVTPTNRKPASYWVMLVIVFVAFISVAATAKAEQSTAMDSLIAEVSTLR